MRGKNDALHVLVVFVVLLSAPQRSFGGTKLLRGDPSGDGLVEISDAVQIFGFLFLGNPLSFGCGDAADADDNGVVELTDGIVILGFLFLGSAPPAQPFPDCGEDETDDDLACESFDFCPQEPILTSISLTPSSVLLRSVGESQAFAVLGTFDDKSTADLTPPESGTTYESSDPLVATIDEAGVLEALANGSTTVTARQRTVDGVEFTATAEVRVEDAVGVVETSPVAGESEVSPERSIVVRLDGPIDPETVTPDSFQIVAEGGRLEGEISVSPTERFFTFEPASPLPPSTEVRVVVDGFRIRGRDGFLIDPDGDDVPGGVLRVNFSTLSLARIPGTDVFGYVYDSYNLNPDGTNRPIVGATIRVDAFPEANVQTDENGFFRLEDMPAPVFFAHVDGSTATNAPDGLTYPSVGKPFHSIPGEATQISMAGEPFDIFLPPMAGDDLQPLAADDESEIGFGDVGKEELTQMFPEVDPEAWSRLVVTFPAGSTRLDDGSPAPQATIIPVDPSRLPGPLPTTAQPSLVISIQVPGVDALDIPAPISFPNLDGAAPGEKQLIHSFDHAAGRWVVVGTGTVSEDGITIASDPGVGIVAPGWHFIIRGTRARFQLGATGGCGSGPDFEHFAVHGTPSLSTWEQIKVGSSSWMSDAELLLQMRAALVVGGSPAQDMVTQFASGTGATLVHGPASPISTSIQGSDAFAAFLRDVEQKIDKEVKRQARSGFVDNTQFKISVPNLSFGRQDPTLWFPIGGTQGRKIFIKDFCVDAQIDAGGGGSGTYSGELCFEICDDFGVSKADLYAPPLIAFWILQHMRIGFVPFIQDIRIDGIPIDGTFAIPPQFEKLDNALPCGAGGGQGSGIVEVTANGDDDAVDGFGSDPTVYFHYDLGDGVALRGTLLPDGSLPDFVLPPDQPFIATFYQPLTNTGTQIAGVSSPSGQDTVFSSAPLSKGESGSQVSLTEFGGPDSDGDGIPDNGELAIGTNSEDRDTDGDGILDGAELDQGLDPLGGAGFPTGIIASLPLPGQARAVTVGGAHAYVATGTHGLAVVNITAFDAPIVQGLIDLPGTATGVAIDTNSEVAAVATGLTLELVDVSDPMLPRRLRPTSFPATRVVTRAGFVYASSGTRLVVVDLVTQQTIQSLTLPGSGQVSGLAREGAMLFAYVSGSDTLVAVDISGLTATVVGQQVVSVASSDVGVFVGDGLAWIVGSGLRTVDVSNPAAMTSIHGADNFFTARRMALNGSGVGVLAPDGNPFVQVYDTSDPNDTDALLFQFPLSGGAQDVAIANGVGYIAAGSRLEVLNYLPFDGQGLAPQVSLSTTASDEDPARPGVQVLEGATLSVDVSVEDDVQVRAVELLVNGKLVASDVSFPFDFTTTAVREALDSPRTRLEARAIDTGGNIAVSPALEIELIPDTTPPSIVHIDPPDAKPILAGLTSIRIDFSEPMLASTFDDENLELLFAGLDDSFGTEDDRRVPLSDISLREDDTVLLLAFDPLVVGLHRLEARMDRITDRARNPLGEVRETILDFDAVPAGPYNFRLSSPRGVPNAEALVTMFIDTVEDLDGWTFGICHDTAVLEVGDAAIGPDTALLNGGAGPNFLAIGTGTPAGSGVTMAVAVSFASPEKLPAGRGRRVLEIPYRLIGALEGGAQVDSELCFCNTLRQGNGPVVEASVTVTRKGELASTEVPITSCATVTISADN